jgi:hypothetical protein
MQVDPLPAIHPAGRCWLTQQQNDTRQPLRRNGIVQGARGAECGITFSGLTGKELEAFEAFEAGASYLRVVGGRLHAYRAYEALPDAECDPLLAPHWGERGQLKHFGGLPPGEGWHSPALIVTAVGAGGRGGDARRSQKSLSECGFVCLRSQRGDDGKYWEQWVLHFMAAAKGLLESHLDAWSKDSGPRDWWAAAEEAARFLTRDLRIAYGSLDITIQRWALCVD